MSEGARGIAAQEELPSPRESAVFTVLFSIPGVVSWISLAIVFSTEFEHSVELLWASATLGLFLHALFVLSLMFTFVAAWIHLPRRRILVIFAMNSSTLAFLCGGALWDRVFS